MTERITATPIDSTEPGLTIAVLEATPIPISLQTKQIISGEAEATGEPISLIEYDFVGGAERKEFIAAWRALKAADLPVAPELWQTSRDTLLTTDVKADGSELYGNELRTALADEQRSRPHTDIDPLFSHLVTPHLMGLIAVKANAYREQADRHMLRLPPYTPFDLLVRPDGTWDLITQDLSFARIFTTRHTEEALAEVRRRNASNVSLFLGGLTETRRLLGGDELSESVPRRVRRFFSFTGIISKN